MNATSTFSGIFVSVGCETTGTMFASFSAPANSMTLSVYSFSVSMAKTLPDGPICFAIFSAK